jgi:drug/metabolite transporter (DMT)-like permease
MLRNKKGDATVLFLIYFLIVLCAGTQSATTKLFNRRADAPAIFNAIKASSALVLFALIAAFGFTLHFPTLLFGFFYGASLCLSMHTGYKALCLGPMALTSMLVSFSVVIPLVFGVTVLDEKLGIFKGIALLLLVFAIVLTNASKLKKGERAEKGYARWLFFVFLTFIANGLCSVIQKQHQTLYPGAYSREFMLFAVLLCAIVFSTAALIRLRPRQIFAVKGKGYAVLSGAANGLMNFFTLVLAGMENASVLFPAISAGTILASLLCGKLIFKEKLKANHYFALGFGILAVVLLKL